MDKSSNNRLYPTAKYPLLGLSYITKKAKIPLNHPLFDDCLGEFYLGMCASVRFAKTRQRQYYAATSRVRNYLRANKSYSNTFREMVDVSCV